MGTQSTEILCGRDIFFMGELKDIRKLDLPWSTDSFMLTVWLKKTCGWWGLGGGASISRHSQNGLGVSFLRSYLSFVMTSRAHEARHHVIELVRQFIGHICFASSFLHLHFLVLMLAG